MPPINDDLIYTGRANLRLRTWLTRQEIKRDWKAWAGDDQALAAKIQQVDALLNEIHDDAVKLCSPIERAERGS